MPRLILSFRVLKLDCYDFAFQLERLAKNYDKPFGPKFFQSFRPRDTEFSLRVSERSIFHLHRLDSERLRGYVLVLISYNYTVGDYF